MTESTSSPILVEPASEHRQAFARWCLAQTPPIPTASARGSLVPAELFGSIPDDLLNRSYIDGHMFRPVIDGFVPHGDGYKDAEVVEEPKQAEPVRRSRKRN